MKKNRLLNSELSHLVATLGHTDEITISDAGLPVAEGVHRIDLALTEGLPGFLDTVVAILSELQVESVVMAEEFPQYSPMLHNALIDILNQEENRTGQIISKNYLSHQDFKKRIQRSRAVVRTGEFTAYANVVFQAGVVF
jgi:D-ribose pyranase